MKPRRQSESHWRRPSLRRWMRLIKDNDEIFIKSADELVEYLHTHDGQFENITLEDTESEVGMTATNVGDESCGSTYSLCYSKAYEKKLFFAFQKGSEAPNISWVAKHFSLFFEKDNRWKGLSEWNEISDRQSAKNLLVIVLLVFGMGLIGYLLR